MKSDWRGVDRILLAKIVKMEVDIRVAEVELDAASMMIGNSEAHKYQTR